MAGHTSETIKHACRFAQSPVSYIEMEPLQDVYLNTDVEIDFRPEAANGETEKLTLVSCLRLNGWMQRNKNIWRNHLPAWQPKIESG